MVQNVGNIIVGLGLLKTLQKLLQIYSKNAMVVESEHRLWLSGMIHG